MAMAHPPALLKALVFACGVGMTAAFGPLPSREHGSSPEPDADADAHIKVTGKFLRGRAISDAFKPVYNPVTRAISDAGLSAQASSGGLPSPRKLNVQVDGVAVTDTRGRRLNADGTSTGMDLDVRYDWAESVVSLMSPAAKDQVELTEYDADQEQPAVGLMVVHLGGTDGTDDPGEPRYYACSDVHDPEAAECQSVQHLFAANGTDDGDVERSGRRELLLYVPVIETILSGIYNIVAKIWLDCANIYGYSGNCIIGFDEEYYWACRSDCCTNTQKYCTAEYPNAGFLRTGNGEYCDELPPVSSSLKIHCEDQQFFVGDPGHSCTNSVLRSGENNKAAIGLSNVMSEEECKAAVTPLLTGSYARDPALYFHLETAALDIGELKLKCYMEEFSDGVAGKFNKFSLMGADDTNPNYWDSANQPVCKGKWYDSDGPEYNCAWYAEGNKCERYGHDFRNFGFTANEACCACKGGNLDDSRPSWGSIWMSNGPVTPSYIDVVEMLDSGRHVPTWKPEWKPLPVGQTCPPSGSAAECTLFNPCNGLDRGTLDDTWITPGINPQPIRKSNDYMGELNWVGASVDFIDEKVIFEDETSERKKGGSVLTYCDGAGQNTDFCKKYRDRFDAARFDERKPTLHRHCATWQQTRDCYLGRISRIPGKTERWNRRTFYAGDDAWDGAWGASDLQNSYGQPWLKNLGKAGSANSPGCCTDPKPAGFYSCYCEKEGKRVGEAWTYWDTTSPNTYWGAYCTHTCEKYAGCHPASSTLELADGRAVRIDQTKEGDLLRTPSGPQPIIGFLHFEETTTGEYFKFHTNDSSASLAISDLHWLFVNGAHASPATVKPGDLLETPAGAAAVTRVEKIVDVGAYHPIVRGGAYYADGILASDYNEKVPELVWDVVRAYAGARFALGVPVVAEGVAVLNPFWAFDGFDEYVPPTILQFLFPILVPATIATDVVNTAAAYPTKALLAAAAVLATAAARKRRFFFCFDM